LGLFWTLSIVLYVEDKKSHNVSETGSVSVLRWMGQDKPTTLPHTRRWIESKTSPIALYNIHHRQNPFKSICIILVDCISGNEVNRNKEEAKLLVISENKSHTGIG
jgi:hypothetical protein